MEKIFFDVANICTNKKKECFKFDKTNNKFIDSQEGGKEPATL